FIDVPLLFLVSFWFQPCWVANLTLMLGLWHLASGRAGAARVAAVVSLGLALTSVPALVFATGHWMTPLVGYYVWLASIALFTAAAWASGRDEPVRSPPDVWRALQQECGPRRPDERVQEGRDQRVQP